VPEKEPTTAVLMAVGGDRVRLRRCMVKVRMRKVEFIWPSISASQFAVCASDLLVMVLFAAFDIAGEGSPNSVPTVQLNAFDTSTFSGMVGGTLLVRLFVGS
jgi:hypothetical protein